MTKEDAQQTIDIWNTMISNARGLLTEALHGKPLPDDEVEIVVATFCLMKQDIGYAPPNSSREHVQANADFINRLRAGDYTAEYTGPGDLPS